MVAQDTFTVEIDGHTVAVAKGSLWHDSDAVVQADEGRGLLFRSHGDAGAPVLVAEG